MQQPRGGGHAAGRAPGRGPKTSRTNSQSELAPSERVGVQAPRMKPFPAHFGPRSPWRSLTLGIRVPDLGSRQPQSRRFVPSNSKPPQARAQASRLPLRTKIPVSTPDSSAHPLTKSRRIAFPSFLALLEL